MLLLTLNFYRSLKKGSKEFLSFLHYVEESNHKLMGMQNEEEHMNKNQASLAEEYSKRKDLINEYCYLTSVSTLTESQADRIEQILSQAQSDRLLEFFLDEADHIVAHQLNLIRPKVIEKQQDKLRIMLEDAWDKKLIEEIPNRLTKLRRKKLQKILKDRGYYDGKIDGLVGIKTNKALKSLKQQKNIDPEDNQLISLCNIDIQNNS